MDRLDRPPGRWGSPTRSVACGRNRAAVPGGVGRRAVPMLPKEQRYSTTTNIVGTAGCRRWVGDIVPVSVKTWLGIGLVSHSPETCRYVGIASVRWSFGQFSPSIGVVNTDSLSQDAQGLDGDGKTRRAGHERLRCWVPPSHPPPPPDLAFPVVLTQPCRPSPAKTSSRSKRTLFPRGPGRFARHGWKRHLLSPKPRDRKREAMFSGGGGGGGPGGIATSQDVSWEENSVGLASGVLRDVHMEHGIMVARRGSASTLLTAAMVSVGPLSRRSELVAFLAKKKNSGMTSINLPSTSLCAPCDSAIRYGSTPQHRPDPSRYSSVSHACTQTEGSPLPRAAVHPAWKGWPLKDAWTCLPISSHHQSSTPPSSHRATVPRRPQEPLKRSSSVSSESGGEPNAGKMLLCPPEMSAWSALSVVGRRPVIRAASPLLLFLFLFPLAVLFFSSISSPGIEPVTRLSTTLLLAVEALYR